MHLVFIPYGIKNLLDFVIEDLNHKYLPLRLYKEGEKDIFILSQTQIRVLPFGIYELVFPKEFKEQVFSALKVKQAQKGGYMDKINKRIMGFKPMDILRKILNLEPIPEYKEVEYPNFPIPEYKKFIPIIPIGIRNDLDFEEKEGIYKGWKHEGL
jgi:hypothetical protein